MHGHGNRFAAWASVALLLGAIGWALAVVAAPGLASTAHPVSPALFVSAATYGLGAIVCHQRPDRSFHSDTVQWPVCARCTGLYVSAGVTAVLVLLARRSWIHATPPGPPLLIGVLLAAAAPTVVSWMVERIGLVTPGNGLRALLAAPLGFAVAALIAVAWRTAEGGRQLR